MGFNLRKIVNISYSIKIQLKIVYSICLAGLIPGQKYVFKLRALSPTNIPGETLRCIVETKP